MKSEWLPLGIVAVAAVAGTASAEDGSLRASKAEVRKAVIATIEEQLGAFRANDRMKAYSLAAGALRARIPPGRFVQIIEQSYPEIRSSTRADYGIVQDNGLRATVNVRVYAEGGRSAAYAYVLVKEPAGWRIEGVVPSEPKPGTRA